MSRSLNGAEQGARNVQRLKAYLRLLRIKGQTLPMRNGAPNRSAISLACGFDRQVLYKNPQAAALLDSVTPISTKEDLPPAEPRIATPQVPDDRDRRIHTLEQQNAALRTEVGSLRGELRRLRHVEAHMVESGRRVTPAMSLGETDE